ncbi:MAG TPA: cell division protein FtsA [Ktedonobacterales bacterium]|nr:cell division protein FtsA [Ktedonobacterales bacterium]
MGHSERAPMIAGLDIGTSKIATLIATIEADGGLVFVAGSETPAHGLRGGVVTNIEAAITSIGKALDAIEDLSGQRITAAYLSIGGAHLHSQNYVGFVSLNADAQDGRTASDPTPGEVTRSDIAQAIAAARAGLPVDERRETLHVIPRAYAVDDIVGVRNPLGLFGFELGVETHIVTGATAACQNLLRCVRAAGVEPVDLIAAPLAASEGVLGVAGAHGETDAIAIADIGAETTELAIYADGAIWRTLSLPIGGAAITQGISAELRLAEDIAEALKRRYGASVGWKVPEDELIDLRPYTQHDELLPGHLLAEIIETRARDLAAALYAPLRDARQADVYPQWLALTGGGASLYGLADFLADDLRIPTYVALPADIDALPDDLAHPGFATVAGVVAWGARQWRGATNIAGVASHVRRGRKRGHRSPLGGLAGVSRALQSIPSAVSLWRRPVAAAQQ